jgi:hypothetical protein
MNVNIRDISGNTLDSLEQRRLLIKKLARKMILETGFSKVTKWGIRISLFCIAMYFIHHDLIYGHFFH